MLFNSNEQGYIRRSSCVIGTKEAEEEMASRSLERGILELEVVSNCVVSSNVLQ